MIREYIIKISDEIMEEEIADRPQELIRCKDCKYYDGNGTCMKIGIAFLTDHWFCADGKKR